MKKLCFLALLLSAIVAAGCSKDDTNPDKEPTLTIETTNYTIADTGGSLEASFEVNVDWTASVEYADSDSKWLTLNPERGKAGKATLTMTAEANASKEERKASVHILYGGETPCVLSVVQSGLNENTNISAFFDPLFAQELQKRGYVADAKHIIPADVKDITELDVSNGWDSDLQQYVYGELTSLRGIEYFESLQKLYCFYNQLTALDVSKHTALETLRCSSNQLTALDVSKNTALKKLDCDRNQLTALDVSNCTALTRLACTFNQLTVLDVSKNTALTWLSCYSNRLTALDVSKNTALTWLSCYSNRLITLDVRKNTALTDLDCWANRLTLLDVSRNTALTRLSCYSNRLITLDVSKSTALTELYCFGNQLTALDVSKSTALETLWCSGNQLTALDVSNCTVLTKLDCYKNQLTTLDVSKNTALTELACDYNPGDGSVFPVTAWFDNNSIPSAGKFTTGSWYTNGKTVRIDYRKAK